jgi:uncharacterized protein (TIGR02246 family)
MWRFLSLFVCFAAVHAFAQAETEAQPEVEATPEAEAPAEPKASVREAVDAGNYFFRKAFDARDAQAIAELYTDDARVIAPGAEPAAGRAAIADFWAGVLRDTKTVRLETLSVESDGNLAFEEGVVQLTANDGSASAARYLVVWKRVGRRWHLHRDIWNAGVPPAAKPAAVAEPPAPTPEPPPTPQEPSPSEAPLAPEEPL